MPVWPSGQYFSVVFCTSFSNFAFLIYSSYNTLVNISCVVATNKPLLLLFFVICYFCHYCFPVDNEAPQFTFCPANVVEQFEVDSTSTGAIITWQQPTAIDNSGGTVQIDQISGPQSGSLFPSGQTITVEYRATDPSGNSATCSFTVMVTAGE